MHPPSDSTPARPEDSPTAWFAVLERARLVADHPTAEKAIRELARLGVKVQFVRPGKAVADAR